MAFFDIVWLIHLSATLIMTGVIWDMQLCHYPLFQYVRQEDFPEFEKQHQWRITLIVVPAMLAELISGGYLGYQAMQNLSAGVSAPDIMLLLNLALLGVIWISTATLQGPMHGKLAGGFDAECHRKLVSSNWIRTVAWSFRAILFLYLTPQLFVLSKYAITAL